MQIQHPLILSIGLFISFLAPAEPPAESWTKVKLSSTKKILHLTGKVVPQDGALSIISSRIQGRVLSFLKKEGEFVKEGTPIYAISSAECLSLAEEKRVANAREMKDLVDAVNRREKQLGLFLDGQECKVISNFVGVIVKRNMEIGTVFNPGDALATVVDTRRLTVELEVPEGDISKVKPQDSVRVKLAGADEPVYGKVDVIVPTIDTGTRTSKIRLKNVTMKGSVSIESLVTADLELLNKTERAFLVPQSSLVFFKNQHYLLKKTSQTPAIVAVTILSEIENSALVKPTQEKDLTEDSEILSDGAIFLFNKIHEDKLK